MNTVRRFIGVRLVCAGAYVRCYNRRDGTAYDGRCPRCLRPISFVVGAKGTQARLFTGDCGRG